MGKLPISEIKLEEKLKSRVNVLKDKEGRVTSLEVAEGIKRLL